MTKHLDKYLSTIAYNFLNLPRYIVTGSGELYYDYRADGVKIRKRNINYDRSNIEDYLDGFQYVIHTRDDNKVYLRFVPTAEGYYDFIDGRYVYNYTDHLGNVRLSYYKNPITGSAEALEENNYYPFGLKHSGYNNITSATPSYQYKYNDRRE